MANDVECHAARSFPDDHAALRRRFVDVGRGRGNGEDDLRAERRGTQQNPEGHGNSTAKHVPSLADDWRLASHESCPPITCL
jgi:hypothetical protein